MAVTSNAGSQFLAAASPRLLNAANAAIILGTTSPIFHVNIAGVPDITSITISAQLIALEGTVTFGCVGGTLTSISGNTCVLTYANMSANIATITATLTYRGQSFTSNPLKISKLLDSASAGTNGLSNAIAYAYQRSATAPTLSPGDITYDFGLGGISFPSVLANNWQKTIPTGTLPLYVTTASASNTSATDAIAATEWSGAVVLAQNGANGTQGLSVATVYIYRRTSASTPVPTLPGADTEFTFATGVLTGLTNGWTTTVPAASGGGFLWVSTATASNTTPTDTLTSGEWAAAQILSQDGTGVGSPGTPGNSVATVTLYQWGTVVPSNPTGVATFTWSSATTTAYTDTATDHWYTTAQANPGSPGIKLFLASVPVVAPVGTTSSTVTFSGAVITAYTQNGANGGQGIPGIKTATVSAYQWNTSAPTTTGLATYTWSVGTYDTPPTTGWTTVKTNAPGSGFTLYEASVRLVESTGASTSSIDWTSATIAGIAYQGTSGGAGSQGASAKRAYILIDGNTLALSPLTITVTGGTTLPPAGSVGTPGTWGETNAWQTTPPSPAAGQTVFQSDGIFDPVTNQTVWNVPYLSQLKVGSLSAISANLGAMTAGSIDLGTGTLSWHVDTSGNMWSGASTYAAAPFRVSSAGDVVMKSLLVQTPGGTTILNTSGLQAGFEAPGTLNSEQTLNALGYAGALNATAGNQLNLDPQGANPSLWTGSVPLFQTGITGGISATTCIRSNGGGHNHTYENKFTPVDRARVYKVSALLRRGGGATEPVYLGVIGSSNNDISGASYSYGLYTRFSVSAASLSASFARYEAIIMPNTMSVGTVSVANHIILGYTGTGTQTGYVEAQDMRLEDITDAYNASLTAQWSNIAGQTNAPANNATVGAPAGTYVGSTEAAYLAAQAAQGQSSYEAVTDATTGLNSRLRNNADQALGGIISVNAVTAPAGFRAGTLTWNASGAYTGGYGTALTPLGLVGYKSDGTLLFSLSSSGLAVKGDISGSTGTFGAVTVGVSLSCGQGAYNTGTGFWMGLVAGTPKFSIGVAGGPSMRWDGSQLLISQATFDSLSVTLSGSLATSVSNGLQGYGNTTATASGGIVQSYVWSITYGSDTGAPCTYRISVGDGTSVISTQGSVTNNLIHAVISCTVTFTDGRTASAARQHNVTHGTYAP